MSERNMHDNFSEKFSSSGNILKHHQGGVEIPRGEKSIARLVSEISHFDISIQKNIRDLISDLRKESPEKAVDIARRIGDFLSNVGEYAGKEGISFSEFLEKLEDEITTNRNKKIN